MNENDIRFRVPTTWSRTTDFEPIISQNSYAQQATASPHPTHACPEGIRSDVECLLGIHRAEVVTQALSPVPHRRPSRLPHRWCCHTCRTCSATAGAACLCGKGHQSQSKKVTTAGPMLSTSAAFGLPEPVWCTLGVFAGPRHTCVRFHVRRSAITEQRAPGRSCRAVSMPVPESTELLSRKSQQVAGILAPLGVALAMAALL